MNDKYALNIIPSVIISLITPIGFFAPIGEWLLLALLGITLLINYIGQPFYLSKKYLYLFFLSCLLISSSHFWTINIERTKETILPLILIFFAIYILFSHVNKINVKNIDIILGLSVFIASSFIFLDLIFDAEIKFHLTKLVGDDPTTNRSGYFDRGLLILTIMLPITISSLLNKKRILFSILVFIMVSLTIFLGSSDTAKLTLLLSIITAITVYFLGHRSYKGFGFIVIIWILSAPFLIQKIAPYIINVEKQITIVEECKLHLLYPENYNNLTITEDTDYKEIDNLSNKCENTIPWQLYKTNLVHRVLVWEFVSKEISKKYILGNGLGTSRLIGQNIILDVPKVNQDIYGAIPLHPHNNILEIWLELGVLGILIYAFIWITLIRLFTKIRSKSYFLGTGACTSLFAIFIVSNLSFGVFQAWWISTVILVIFISVLEYKNFLKSN